MKHIFNGISEHNITTETSRILGHNFVLVNLQVALHAWSDDKCSSTTRFFSIEFKAYIYT